MRHAPLLALLLLAAPVAAQHAGDQHRQGAAAPAPQQPCAGLGARDIKALSAEEIAGLRAGRGMAPALPAEPNPHPGPMHALEHADALRLAPAQRAELERQMRDARARAAALDERVIGAERALGRRFAERRATPEAVRAASLAVGEARGELRAAHLVTHLETVATLTPAQVALYGRLRGYRAP